MVDGLEDDGVCCGMTHDMQTQPSLQEQLQAVLQMKGRDGAQIIESEGQQSWSSDEGKEKWKVDAIDVRSVADEGVAPVAGRSGGRDGRGLCGWRRQLLWGGLYSGAEAVAL